MQHFDPDKPHRRGSELSPKDQHEVLSRYTHRYTGDHKPAWAQEEWKDGKPYPLQFRSDAEWLANTDFQTTRTGKLDKRVGSCYSHPTWPEGNPYGIVKAS